jgi:hypothetical protein
MSQRVNVRVCWCTHAVFIILILWLVGNGLSLSPKFLT